MSARDATPEMPTTSLRYAPALDIDADTAALHRLACEAEQSLACGEEVRRVLIEVEADVARAQHAPQQLVTHRQRPKDLVRDIEQQQSVSRHLQRGWGGVGTTQPPACHRRHATADSTNGTHL
jgi:hypothetical protein